MVWILVDSISVPINNENWLLFFDGVTQTISILTMGLFSLFLYQYLTQGKNFQTLFYVVIGTTSFFLILRLTNPLHHLYYREINFLNVGPALRMLPIYGPFFSAHTVIFSLVLSFALFFVMTRRYAYQRILHFQLTITLYAMSFFLIYHMLTAINVPLIKLPLLSHFAILPSLIFCMFAIQYDLLNLQPVAVENPLEELKDGIISFSGDGIVVDLNNQMCRIIRKPWNKVAGKNLEDVFPDLYAKLEETGLYPTDQEDTRRKVSHFVFDLGTAHYDTVVYFTSTYIKVTMHDITELVENFKTNRNLASRDPLTGIFNRRQGEQAIKDRLKNEEFGDISYCFVVFDIDYFKQINDQFGHQTGDLILKEIAQVFTHSIRPSDIFGRFGGDEFIVYLHMVKPELAKTILERIQESIRTHTFLSDDGEVVKPTLSIGAITSSTGLKLSYDDLFLMADEALYEAKEKGRDQVVVRHHTPFSNAAYL